MASHDYFQQVKLAVKSRQIDVNQLTTSRVASAWVEMSFYTVILTFTVVHCDCSNTQHAGRDLKRFID